MPPKKKKGKGKKKKKTGDGELTTDDKYKKTLDEIEALKDHLAVRKETARRSRAQAEEWKSKMATSEEVLEKNEDEKKAVSSEMTRQYKTMQTELKVHIHMLETELARTRNQLNKTEVELRLAREEMTDLKKAKDLEVEALQQEIKSMADKYTRIFLDNLEKLKQDMIENETRKWAQKAQLIQSRNKQTLLEFGLHPLDI